MAKISNKDLSFLCERFGIEAMNISDIEQLEIAKPAIVKLINSYRKVFIVEKIDSEDDAESKKLLGKLEFTVALLEQMDNLQTLRLDYYKKIEKKDDK